MKTLHRRSPRSRSLIVVMVSRLASLILLTAPVFAQNGGSEPLPVGAGSLEDNTRWMIGGSFAGSFNYHSGGFRQFSDTACDCGHFEDGRANGYQIGGIVRHDFSNFYSLELRFAYDERPAKFEKNLPEALVIMPGTNEVVEQRVVARAEVDYRLWTTDVMSSFRFLSLPVIELGASVGPTFSFVERMRITQTQELLSPANARFTNPEGYVLENDGRRIVYMRDTEVETKRNYRLSVKGGPTVAFTLFDPLIARAGVFVDYGITDVTSSENWQLTSIIMQLDLFFGF